MDRSLYISYTILLDKCILVQNRRFFYIFLHILNTKHKYAYQVFSAVAGENRFFMLISLPIASLVLLETFCIYYQAVFYALFLMIEHMY